MIAGAVGVQVGTDGQCHGMTREGRRFLVGRGAEGVVLCHACRRRRVGFGGVCVCLDGWMDGWGGSAFAVLLRSWGWWLVVGGPCLVPI